MSVKKQRLELTWIGKDETPKLEPRILLKDEAKSYGEESGNMLVKGDNLLALKALEQAYAGKVKCVYIDPPYNTGARIDADGKEVGYEDGLEHSEWLNMMKPRLEMLERLLSKDGTLIVQIDDNEFARLWMIMEEIFGERNLKTIVVKMSEPTGVKMAHAINSGRIPKLKEFLIIARKDGIKNLFVEKVPKEKWDNEYKTVLFGLTKKEIALLKEIRDNQERTTEDLEICDKLLAKLTTKSLSDEYRNNNISTQAEQIAFNFENSWRIVQIVSMSGGAKHLADEKKNLTVATFFCIQTPQKKLYFIKSDYDISVSTPRIKVLFADDYLTVHPGDFWQDIKTTSLDNEGGVDFKKGKKPEALIKRIIDMATEEGELVLDSFGGSGTTAAVAHKMNRKWITVEMGSHCESHIIPRLKNVIDGVDAQGVTQILNWSGGGGFAYYSLAPSLIRIDEFGQAVIDERYNADMLAAAMAVHEGFVYAPDAKLYWKQGAANETDYIYTTTGHITLSMLDTLADGLKEGESLVVCAKSFDAGCNGRNKKITLKKIPQAVLDKCEYKPDGYPLNIVNPPIFEDEEEE